MGIIDRLATSLNRKDEVPNQELAEEIVSSDNVAAVAELVENLKSKNKDIQSDCIKVIYEIGAKKPDLIVSYASDFMELLDSRNNRLQWGAMTALQSITSLAPSFAFEALGKLAAIADAGSVITRDNYVGILAKLYVHEIYREDAFALLTEQLKGCPSNQLPMYAELIQPLIDKTHKPIFIDILSARLGDFEKESKRTRVEKVIKKVNSGK